MNKKAELFRQIGWSQELIEHFTICEDTNDVHNDDFVEAHFIDSETAIVRFEATNTTSNAEIVIK